MSNSLTLDQTRRNNLRKYLEEHPDRFKSLTEFSKQVGVYVSNLSPIINGDKRFTDKLAETIEGKLKLPEGYLSSLSKSENIYIPFYKYNGKSKDAESILTRVGDYLELNKDIIDDSHKESNSLFAIKPDVEIGREALKKSVGIEKILIFDKSETHMQFDKIYLVLFYGNLLLRRCKKDNENYILDSDCPEVYSKIIVSTGKDAIIIGKLVYSASLESY